MYVQLCMVSRIIGENAPTRRVMNGCGIKGLSMFKEINKQDLRHLNTVK